MIKNTARLGMSHTEETKVKLKNQPHRKRVVDGIGKVYDSVSEAARSYGITRAAIRQGIRYGRFQYMG